MMKPIAIYLLCVPACLAAFSCKEEHQKVAKSKYGDADRIKCIVLAKGGAGATVDSVLSRVPTPILSSSLASILKLPGSRELRENLVVCEKRWYWGGAMRGFRWFEVSNRTTLVISTPSSVPSGSEIVIFTSRRAYGESGEYRNYKVLGSVGNIDVWRYEDEIRAGE